MRDFPREPGKGVSPVKERVLKFSSELSTEYRKVIRLDRNFRRYQEGNIGTFVSRILKKAGLFNTNQQGWYREDIFPVPSY